MDNNVGQIVGSGTAAAPPAQTFTHHCCPRHHFKKNKPWEPTALLGWETRGIFKDVRELCLLFPV